MRQPATPARRIYIKDYEIAARLAALGVEFEWLREAVLQGDFVRKSTSTFEFPGAKAYKAASKGLEVVRRASLDAAWTPGSYWGIPVAWSPARTVAISVTEGDEYAGVLGDQDPSTKALKGPNTTVVADRNRLFEDAPVSFFYLLTYSADGLLRAELSSPSWTEDGRVRGWDERILFGDIVPDGGARVASRPDAPAPVVAPNVEPRRKGA